MTKNSVRKNPVRKAHTNNTVIDDLLHEDESARSALAVLANRGCDRDYVLSVLQEIARSRCADTWEEIAGMNLKSFRALLERMNRCARELELVHSHFAATGFRHVGPRLRAFASLPQQLADYATILNGWRKGVGPLRHPSQKIAKSKLVAYVWRTTGRKFHKDLAALISAVLDELDYDENRQKMFCQKYASLCRPLDSRKPTALQPPPSPPPVPPILKR